MLTLFHSAGARSLRVLWMLEEMGLDYSLKVLKPPVRARYKDYLEINPLGTVPTLYDDGHRMTESVAMIHYLATRYGPTDLALGIEEPDYAEYLNYLVHGEATLTFPQTVYLRYTRFEPDAGLEEAGIAYKKWFLSRTRLVDSVLAEQQWLCGGRFTAADISVGYAFILANSLGYAGELSPVLQDYLQRLAERDGLKRARERETQAAESADKPLTF